MNGVKVVGLLLVILGLIALLYSGFSYTRREKVEIAGVSVEKKTTNSIPIPPIAGGLALIGGVVILLVGGRQAGGRRAS